MSAGNDGPSLREAPAQWHQPATRRPRPWSWSRQRGKASPLQDDDAFQDFVGSLRSRIEHRLASKLDDKVQLEIASLTRLLNSMPHATVYRNRAFFEMAFDLLAADRPNLLLVAQIRQGLTVAEEQSSGIGRVIVGLFGRTPIQTVVFGLFSIFACLFVAIVVLDQTHSLLEQLGTSFAQLHPVAEVLQKLPLAEIIVLVVGAFTGAIVSVLARFRSFLQAARVRPLLVYVTVATKPFVSIAFATFIYAIMGSGLVTLPGVSLVGPDAYDIVWVVGFLSGFSERFVQDFVAETDRLAAGPPPGHGAAPGKNALDADPS